MNNYKGSDSWTLHDSTQTTKIAEKTAQFESYIFNITIHEGTQTPHHITKIK